MKRITFEKVDLEIRDSTDLEKTITKKLDERLVVFQLLNSASANPKYRELNYGLIDLLRLFDVLKEKKEVYEFEDADFERLNAIVNLPGGFSSEEHVRSLVRIQKKFEMAKAEIEKK